MTHNWRLEDKTQLHQLNMQTMLLKEEIDNVLLDLTEREEKSTSFKIWT